MPMGEAEILLEFGTVQIRQKFLIVKECSYELLSGLLFCQTAQLVIDFPAEKLQIGRRLISKEGRRVPLMAMSPRGDRSRPA